MVPPLAQAEPDCDYNTIYPARLASLAQYLMVIAKFCLFVPFSAGDKEHYQSITILSAAVCIIWQKTRLLDTLQRPSDPDYDGPKLPLPPPGPEAIPIWPSWFGYGVNRSSLPPKPAPPPPPSPPDEGVPDAGPYTVGIDSSHPVLRVFPDVNG